MSRRLALLLLWLISDGLVFTGSYSLAYFVKVGWILSSDLPYATYLQATMITATGWLFVMITMRNYALSRIQKSPRNFLYIAYACVIGMAGFALSFYFLRQQLFSRLLLLIAGILSSITVYIWHIVFDQFQRRALRYGKPVYPVLIIGTNREAEQLVTSLQKNLSPFMPVGVLDGRGTSKTELAGIPILGKLNKLEDIIQEKHITHLVQCDQLEHSINLHSICKTRHITYMLLPFVLGVIENQLPTEALEGKPVIAIDHLSRSSLSWFFR